MSERSDIRSERRARVADFLLAAGLGHLVGAYIFVVTLMLLGTLIDLWVEGPAAFTPSSWGRLLEGLLAFPVVTGLAGLWGAFLMIPATLLTLPIAWLAARHLATGAATTMVLGALTGLLPAAIMLHGAPRPDLRLYGSAAAAGAAFAAIIWLICIKPRRG